MSSTNKLNPENEPCLKAVADFFRQHPNCQTKQIYLGLSGGADSSALLLAMKASGQQIKAVHFNHGLRDLEADADEQWSAAFCKKHDIPCQTVQLDVKADKETGESIEMAARRLRLTWWQKHLDPEKDLLTLAHHQDDQLETALMRLMRGSNVSGICGLRPYVTLGALTIIRPFLNCRREDIIRFLKKSGVNDYCRDSSNLDQQFLRNRIRHELLPLMADIAGNHEGLYHSLSCLGDDADALENAAAVHYESPLTVKMLKNHPPALQIRLLHLWLQEESAGQLSITTNCFTRLQKQFSENTDQGYRIDLDGNYFIRIQGGRFSLEEKDIDVPAPMTWHWQKDQGIDTQKGTFTCETVTNTEPNDDTYCELFDAALLDDTLKIRYWQKGDKMELADRKKPVSLKKLFSDAGIGGQLRMQHPLLCRPDDTIIWIPGLRRAAFGMLTDDSKDILKIKYKGS